MNQLALRVAITHTRYSPHGGIEKYIHSLVVRLLDAGHEVHFLASRFDDEQHPRLVFRPIPWQRFPKAQRVLSFDRGVNAILARESFDVVHGFTKTSRQDIYTDGSGTLDEYVAATRAEQPAWRRRLYLATPHQRAIRAMEERRFQRDAILKIIPMAEFVRDQILRTYPVDPARVEVLYNGVETERFHPDLRASHGAELRARLGVGEEDRLIAFAGNDWRRKGLATALEALAALPAAGVGRCLLVVAGSDNHEASYRRQARRLGVGERVRWLGSVREIERVFAASDLFAFPTRYDVFGNVGLEAMASGVPSVLSARAGVAEIIAPQRAGACAMAGARLEDPRDASELAGHCRRLLAPGGGEEPGPGERRRAARALAERYSWDDHFARLLEIYREVAAEKRARAGWDAAAAPGERASP